MHYWPFVRGIHRSTLNFPQNSQWCEALVCSLLLAWTWISCWTNGRFSGDLRRHDARMTHQYGSLLIGVHYVTVISSWWRHQMEIFSALLVLCEGKPPVTGGFPSQRPVTQSFDVFFDQRPNKRPSKQSRRRRIETPSRSLWRHFNVCVGCVGVGVEVGGHHIWDALYQKRLGPFSNERKRCITYIWQMFFGWGRSQVCMLIKTGVPSIALCKCIETSF